MSALKKILQAIFDWSKKHISFLKGVFALIAGVTFIYISHKLILNIIVFSGGAILIYYGLVELKLKKITNIIDGFVTKLKK